MSLNQKIVTTNPISKDTTYYETSIQRYLSEIKSEKFFRYNAHTKRVSGLY